MPLPVLNRLLVSLSPSAAQDGAATRAETRPPAPHRQHASWAQRFGLDRSKRTALSAARMDFVDALRDLRTPVALDTKTRVVVARSLHELWHFREQVFSLVACCHDQAEATRRLACLDRHFAQRTRRPGSSVPPDSQLSAEIA